MYLVVTAATLTQINTKDQNKPIPDYHNIQLL
jgi:hypothetical protein